MRLFIGSGGFICRLQVRLYGLPGTAMQLQVPALDTEHVFYYTLSHVYLAAPETPADRLTAKE